MASAKLVLVIMLIYRETILSSLQGIAFEESAG
jgi:hypothetical protein